MGVTYPAPPPAVSGDIIEISRFLQNPTLLQRALRTLAQQKFIADSLLTGRFVAQGGAVLYEQNESIYTSRIPESIAPGAEYPLTGIDRGPAQVVAVQKWGQDVPVTDEAIKRFSYDPVTRAFTKLVNQMVKTVDGMALAAITSQVTNTEALPATFDKMDAADIFTKVMLASAEIQDELQGYTPDTVVCDSTAYVTAMAAFVKAGYVPRETNADNPALTGNFPTIGGMRWMYSPNIPVKGSVMVLDSTQLGGMADEALGGPGYAGASSGVETKSIRDEENDAWRLRARRVCAPIVLNPNAAKILTGASA